MRCNNTVVINGQTIRYIAVPVTDAARANRFMQLGSTALLSGKRLRGSLPTASTTNAPGCGASDCRTPDAFAVLSGQRVVVRRHALAQAAVRLHSALYAKM